MMFVEMTVEEAMKMCNKNAKVLVAVRDLEKQESETFFVRKEKKDYKELFKDVETVGGSFDDFVKQILLYTAKQDLFDIKPKGVEKIILLKE